MEIVEYQHMFEDQIGNIREHVHFITILTSYLNDEKKTPKQKQKSTKKPQNKTKTKITKPKKKNKPKKTINNKTKFPSYITCHLTSKVITSLK